MAAYAALVSLAQTIVHILNRDSYSFSLHQKGQIASIHKHLIFLQTFLEDFPEKSNNSLEEQIRDTTNRSEDTIEYLMYENDETRVAVPLAQLIVEIDSITLQVMNIKNSVGIKDLGLGGDDSPDAASSSSRRYSAPTHKKDVIVGFDSDLLAIKERLCGESSKLQVIPVVGMGGIGKTTLARNAYHDPLIAENFQIRAWVTVSQEYSAQEILSDLQLSMKEFNTVGFEQNNELNVYQSLKGRKCLIVMDDIWSTKAWDDVRRIFPDDNNGSRVILTTRLSDVAVYADSSSHLHQMYLMSMDQSWDLLRQKVFKQDLCPLELENIGMEIARRCQGLPLAIVVVAGLLSTVSTTQASWKKVAKNVNSTIAMKDRQIEMILSLSYSFLPHHLRPCFLYMGAFPEDHEIHVSKLIKLWVADGFLKSSESKSLEEMAEEYLEDLVKRSLVLVSKRKCNGKIKTCSLHDLIRELCIRKAQQEKFLIHDMDGRIPGKSTKNQRCICITQSELNCLANVYGSTTRTILSFLEIISLGYLPYFRFLRILDLAFAYGGMTEIPAQVFELFHLRYLAFGYRIQIPAAISKLQNLQTLIINPRRRRTSIPCKISLPLEIWNMPQLRHLVCLIFYKFGNPEGATSALENLYTLSAVTDLVCSERMVKMVLNVKKLGIFYSAKEYDDEDYHLENLVHLQQLEKLKLIVIPRSSSPLKLNPSFPRTLKKLSLSGWRLPWEDTMRIVGSMPNLQVLKLRKSQFMYGGKWKTNDGEFQQLKFLLIENSQLQYWITESSHFPTLISLLLHHCDHLSERDSRWYWRNPDT